MWPDAAILATPPPTRTLIEIVATTRRCTVRSGAIAKRDGLGGDLTAAVAATLDVSAVAQLLANEKAEIREETLNKVIAQAAGIEVWHRPLVMRADLSVRAMRRIATFVSRSLIDELGRRHDLDDDTALWLKARAQASIEADDAGSEKPLTVEAMREAHKEGRLGDEMVTGAATLAHRQPVVTALSLLAGVPAHMVETVIDSRSGRGISALCWKAGLSMRTALAVQTHIAHVPTGNLVLPREGIDYPLKENEIRWHLQYFGIEAGGAQRGI